ncbi:MAG: hypothetical protein K1Y02_18995, partial [Candidatus Hydrogenedentes bacterium]|nr:hypothetical protein [Candidatus Hydrogenedentota bacterium]
AIAEIARLLLAGLLVFAGLTASGIFIGSMIETHTLPAYIYIPLVSVCVLLIFALVHALFNWRHLGFGPRKSKEEFILELDDKQLLDRDDYTATRAFEVMTSLDDGSHYFVELTDGRVLFLTGQYLYEYDPIGESGELDQPRQFPCTEFTVLRHKTDKYVVHIECRGAVLEPEIEAPHFTGQLWDEFGCGDDVTIIASKTYEEIKRRMMASPP